jgi:spore coat polysaccharide biosynthesis protein SpsF
MAMKVVGIVQARLGSTRLPGKVLLPVEGRPLLEHMLARLRHATQLNELVVATTTLATDRSIAALAATLGLRCAAGHPTDLIDRHLAVARSLNAEVVVKIPSDCAVIDPRVVDRVVAAFRGAVNNFDYISNLHPATWPDGNDVEVFTREALEMAFLEADRPYEREHTTPFIWDQPDRFRIGNVYWGGGRDLSRSHRLVLDHPEDFEVITAVYRALGTDPQRPFAVDDIVEFLDRNPQVRDRNARHRDTGWPAAYARQLRTGSVSSDQRQTLSETRSS